jgi:hypothetical protein
MPSIADPDLLGSGSFTILEQDYIIKSLIKVLPTHIFSLWSPGDVI